MNWLTTTLILLAAILMVFGQAAFTVLRDLVGTQPNLLPGLMVFAALRTNPQTMALLAFVGGLGFDSLSANPLGISVLPLYALGFVIYSKRDLIVKDQVFAQVFLGLGASLLAPVLSLGLLLTTGAHPLLGWGTLWQLGIMTVIGGVLTPVWFEVFSWLEGTFVHKHSVESSFRPDREIRRGRA